MQERQHSRRHNRIHVRNSSHQVAWKASKLGTCTVSLPSSKNLPCVRERRCPSSLLPQAIGFIYPGIKDTHLPPRAIDLLPPQAIENTNTILLPQAIRPWNAAPATQKQQSPAALKKKSLAAVKKCTFLLPQAIGASYRMSHLNFPPWYLSAISCIHSLGLKTSPSGLLTAFCMHFNLVSMSRLPPCLSTTFCAHLVYISNFPPVPLIKLP